MIDELKTLKGVIRDQTTCYFSPGCEAVEPEDLKEEGIKHIKYILEDNHREVKDISLLPDYYRGQVNFMMSFFGISSKDLE